MSEFETLYGELKGDMQTIATPLLDFAQQQVRLRGMFLPFGASLDDAGQITLAAAGTEREMASSIEILPILHDGLRDAAARGKTTAIAVCEWVKITPQGGAQTDAIKVLVEHVRGLTVAFYLPCRKRMLRGWQFGEMIALPADPEVRAWGAAGTR
ncbi:MAG: hypothetical protein ABFE13_06700 [Phycisphaerales bacterium]